MVDPVQPFPASEFEDRIERLQSGMASRDISALLLTQSADIFYTTGFLTRFWESPARPWFIVLPAQGMPIAVIPAIGAPVMARTIVRDIRTWDAPFPEDDGVSLLADTLRDLVPAKGRIGVAFGPETRLRMPLGDFGRVTDLISPRSFVDATAVMRAVREIKSEAEIARITACCALTGRAFDKVPEIARPGVPLDRIFRDFQIALLSEGADWVSYLAGGAEADGYSDVISPARPVPLRQGDILMLDAGAVLGGYFCDLDRNFAIGEPSQAALKAHAALWKATEEALEAVRPGMRAGDLHRLMADAVVRHGATPCGGRLGHGLGVALTEWPSLSPWDTTELRAGMVLTLEPSALTSERRMIVHEENIVLRETGAELLSPRAPETLPLILS